MGAEFISDWAGLTLGDLFDRIRTTMPQDNPGKLSRDTYAEILAFLLKENGYPAGQKPLDKRSPYLKAIAFVPPPAQAAPSSQHSSAAAPAQVAQAAGAPANGSAMRGPPRAAIPAFGSGGIGGGGEGLRRPVDDGGRSAQRAQQPARPLCGR